MKPFLGLGMNWCIRIRTHPLVEMKTSSCLCQDIGDGKHSARGVASEEGRLCHAIGEKPMLK